MNDKAIKELTHMKAVFEGFIEQANFWKSKEMGHNYLRGHDDGSLSAYTQALNMTNEAIEKLKDGEK